MKSDDNKLIELQDVSKVFDKTAVLFGLNLDIFENDFLSIIGPSGSGKSTILKLICGVLEPSRGSVLFRGRPVYQANTELPKIIMLWQSLALFPHLNVEKNVGFGLMIRRTDKTEIANTVGRMLDIVGLSGFEKRSINELSGGEKQRVALARALIMKPEVILLDEPLGALDTHLRFKLLNEIRRIHREMAVTVVMVTHDQSEALETSSRIAVLNKGKIEQIGTANDIVNKPATGFVAEFVGKKNVFSAKVIELDGAYVKVIAGNKLSLRGKVVDSIVSTIALGDQITYVIDRHKILIGSKLENAIDARILSKFQAGNLEIIDAENDCLGIVRCESILPSDQNVVPDGSVTMCWDTNDAHVYPTS